MTEIPAVDERAEADGRVLLATACETAPVGDGLAGPAAFGGTLLADVRRRARQRRRVRAVVPAGAVLAGAGAAVLGLALTTTVATAPSAAAAVTAAADKTASQSFRVSVVSQEEVTAKTSLPGLHAGEKSYPALVTEEYDPSRGVGEEKFGGETIIIADGDEYLQFPNHKWMESSGATAIPIGVQLNDGLGGQPIDPSSLLQAVKAAGQVTDDGATSGAGWTGTRYGFTLPVEGTTIKITGTVSVDRTGRLRLLDAVVDRPGQLRLTMTATFSDFGLPVSVTPPPASSVFLKGKFHFAGPGARFPKSS